MKQIFEQLKQQQNNSYVPYSKFKVAAIVKTKKGDFAGNNIENASYPATICAERSALVSAYSNGIRKTDILEIYLITDSKDLGTPCGICRQVMFELCSKNVKVHIFNIKGDMKVMTVSDLLPGGFGGEQLNV